MVYIPNEWIKYKKNEENVHELLNELDNDIIVSDTKEKKQEIIKKLENLGETIIIEKIINNKITLGA
ncbi:hypothetical protein KPL26_03135 [Clostridium algidicarnis]|uniref:hypothetical protein n=1 Tax=Clostridium algidicarnis TaxID=37659 RepID=UPI001C0C4427|nr:hypothetical protein [Clostridium algidicarnis]MBU3195657.1 hypothetical protein [Clostridium algidicarnis]